MDRFLGPGLNGLLYGAGFGIISSACSYGAAAAARGFFRSGADVRSIFAFLISSTNMNVAIVILFWSLLGWRFAFAEFFGGIIIIAVVTVGVSLLFRGGALARMQRGARAAARGRRRDDEETNRRSVGRGGFDGDCGRADAAHGAADRLSRRGIRGGADSAGVLATVLHAVGNVPFAGYLLLLVAGL